MALGGESGFAAGYTPIRFAPLVSLTGPITAPVPPAAPEAPVAPMIRLPVYQGDAGDYGGMPHKYAGGPPVGGRSREALKADLANAVGFFVNPFGTLANYVLTGQTPAMQFGVGNQREALGLQQSDTMWEGVLPKGGIRDAMTRARNLLFGEQKPSVSLGEAQGGQPAGAPAQRGFSPEMGFSVANDAYQMALSSGADEQAAMNAANTAASLVAQGVDPITAATISAQYAVGAAGPQMPEMPAAAPAAVTPAQTFAVGRGSQIESSYEPSFSSGLSEAGGYGGTAGADGFYSPEW